jgi:serine/threonine protein kinase
MDLEPPEIGGSRRVQVAVKMLFGLSQTEERETFEQELKAHMHAARHSDGVCMLYGTCECEVDGVPRMCIVMKLYACSLHTRIGAARRASAYERLDEAALRRFAYVLCRTLQQLHACGVLLRDINSHNILLPDDEHGDPVFADFGISHVLQTHITPTSMHGTFNYMAPEAFNARGRMRRRTAHRRVGSGLRHPRNDDRRRAVGRHADAADHDGRCGAVSRARCA